MPKKDDVEEKVAWYQTLTPTLQKQMIASIEKGAKVVEGRMSKLLSAFKRDGGFKSTTDAWKWLKTKDPKNTDDLRRQLDTVSDPEMRRKLAKEIDMENHRFGYTREKYLANTIRIQNQRMAEDMKVRGSGTVENVAKMGYLYKNYEISKKSRVGFSVGGFPEGLIRSLTTKALDDTRTIGYFDTVSQGMKDELLIGITSGMSSEQIAQRVHGKMQDRELWVSRAFARTSVCEVSAQAEKTCMEECGIKRYTYRCTLDETTCPVCGGLDGRNFLVKDAKAGYNYPPMHRNCRCTEVPFLTKEASEGLKRRARDENGKSITVDRDMSYREWAEKYAPKSASKLPPISPMEGEQFHREKKEILPDEKYTQDERDTISKYTEGKISYVNEFLRQDVPLSKIVQRNVNNLDSAIAKEMVTEDTLYRSVDMEVIFGKMSLSEYAHTMARIKVMGDSGGFAGKKYTEKGFMSTTTDKTVAKGIKNPKKESVVLKFTNAKGKNGVNVGKALGKAEQDEVLLGRGMKYKINKVYIEDGQLMADCEFVTEEAKPVKEKVKKEIIKKEKPKVKTTPTEKPPLDPKPFTNSITGVSFSDKHIKKMTKVVEEISPKESVMLWNRMADKVTLGSNKHDIYKGACEIRGKVYLSQISDTKPRTIKRKNAEGKIVDYEWDTEYETVFHEYGHAIDEALAEEMGDPLDGNHFISNSYKSTKHINPETGEGYTLEEMVRKEVRAEVDTIYNEMVEKAKAEGKPIPDKTSAEWEMARRIKDSEDIREWASFSDMMEGATVSHHGLGIGHGTSYWYRRGALGTETFAEMHSATMLQCDSLKSIKKHVPKAYEIFLEIVEVKGKGM